MDDRQQFDEHINNMAKQTNGIFHTNADKTFWKI